MKVELDSTQALYVYGRIKLEKLNLEKVEQCGAVESDKKTTLFLESILDALESAYPGLSKAPFEKLVP